MRAALSQTIATVKVYKASGFLRETELAAAKRVLPDDEVLKQAFEHVYDGVPLPETALDAFQALTQPPEKTVPVESIVSPPDAISEEVASAVVEDTKPIASIAVTESADAGMT